MTLLVVKASFLKPKVGTQVKLGSSKHLKRNDAQSQNCANIWNCAKITVIGIISVCRSFFGYTLNKVLQSTGEHNKQFLGVQSKGAEVL